MQHSRDGDHARYLHHLQLATQGGTDPEGRVILPENEYWLAKAEFEFSASKEAARKP